MRLEHLESCNLCGSNELRVLDGEANIDECLSCGYMFDNPRPLVYDIIAFYSTASKYDSWLEELEEREYLWKRRLAIIRKFVSDGSLLDIGSGIGQFLYHAKKHFTVYGTEVSDEAIRIAKDRYDTSLSKCVIEDSDAFLEGSFDVVTLIHVLEHVPNPSITVKRVWELLREGGFLFIAVPNDRYAFWRHGGLFKYCLKKILSRAGVEKYKNLSRFEKIVLDPGIQTEIHLSHFTPDTLSRFIGGSGFEIVARSLDPYFSAIGLDRLKEEVRFHLYRAIDRVFSCNLYETILIIARKKKDSASKR